jgi:putative addiction module component (TIGR02574 family)
MEENFRGRKTGTGPFLDRGAIEESFQIGKTNPKRIRRRFFRMSCKEVLEQALRLKPDERFLVVEGLLESLDEPDKAMDEIWAVEAEKRLHAYREGRLEGVPMEDVL